jgi:hypothetical protein
MVFHLLSSDVSQEPEGNQRARKGVLRAHTRQGGGSGLVAYHFPELDGRLQGSHVYAGRFRHAPFQMHGLVGDSWLVLNPTIYSAARPMLRRSCRMNYL